MNLQFKRRLDRWLGQPALTIFNALARALGAVLRRDHAVLPARVIVVMKFQGLGSFVIAKPAIARVRAAHPGARIVFWGTRSTALIAAEMPEIDEILIFNDSDIISGLRSLFSNLTRLWSLKPDWVFDLEAYSKVSSVFATLTCARNRAGFAVESVNRRRHVHTHLVFFNRYEYLGRSYARLLGLLADSGPEPFAPAVWRSELPIAPALAGIGPYCVMSIHTGDLAPERRWPREAFEFVAMAILNANTDWHVVLIGNGSAEVIESAKFLRHNRLLDLTGKMSLKESMGCLARASLVISNDTGPLHLALAGPAPVVALFGPTYPRAYLPPSRPKTEAISRQLFCSPCVHHWDPLPCHGDNQCMKGITPLEVLEAGRRLVPGLALPAGPDLGRLAAPAAKLDPKYYPGLVY